MKQQQILIDQLKQIEETYNKIIQSFKALIEKYDNLKSQEQQYLIKGITRMQKLLMKNDGSEQISNQSQSQGSTFSSQQIEFILKQVNNQIDKKLYEVLRQQLLKGISQPSLEVETTALNKQPQGLGVLLQIDCQIFFGYIYQNVFQYGIQIKMKNNEIDIKNINIMEFRNQIRQSRSINKDLIDDITNCTLRIIEKMNQNCPKFQMSLNKRINQVREILRFENIVEQLKNYDLSQLKIIKSLFYCGGLIEKVENNKLQRLRHGYGGFININHPVIAIGLWEKDNFRWGIFLALENEMEVFNVGQMEDHIKFYLQIEDLLQNNQ